MKIGNLIVLLYCLVGSITGLPYASIKNGRKSPIEQTKIDQKENQSSDFLRLSDSLNCSKYLNKDEDESDSDSEGSGSGYGPIDDEDLFILCMKEKRNQNKDIDIGADVFPYSPKSTVPELGSGLGPLHNKSAGEDLDFGLKPLNPEDSIDSIGRGIFPIQPKSSITTIGTFIPNPGSKFGTTAVTHYPEAFTDDDSDEVSTVNTFWPKGEVDHAVPEKDKKNRSPHVWWKNLDHHWNSLASKTKNATNSLRISIHSWYTDLRRKIPEVLHDMKKTVLGLGSNIQRGIAYVVETLTQTFDKVRAQELKKKLNQRLKQGDEIVGEFLQKVGEKFNSWLKKDKQATGINEHLPEEGHPNIFKDPEIHKSLDRLVDDGILDQTDVNRLFKSKNEEQIKQNEANSDSSKVSGNAQNEVYDSYYATKRLHPLNRPTNQDKFHLKEIYFPA